MSAEAIIGTGITIWALGILFLLLGWAQHMQLVKDAFFTLLVIGGVLFVFGGMIAVDGARGLKFVSRRSSVDLVYILRRSKE